MYWIFSSKRIFLKLISSLIFSLISLFQYFTLPLFGAKGAKINIPNTVPGAQWRRSQSVSREGGGGKRYGLRVHITYENHVRTKRTKDVIEHAAR